MAAQAQQAVDALSPVPTARKGSLLLPPACLALHSLGVGCAVGAVRCQEVHPVGILAKGISAGKQKALAGKQGVTFCWWLNPGLVNV